MEKPDRYLERVEGARTRVSHTETCSLARADAQHGYTDTMPDGAPLSAAPAREARCVAWHERGTDLKPELLAALNRPGFSVVRCDDEFAAVAHVCRLARDTRTIQPAPLVILLLVDPEQLRSVVPVVEAVARHAPTASVWMYDLKSSPQLRTVRSADMAHWRTIVYEAPDQHAPEITVLPVSMPQTPAVGGETPTDPTVTESPKIVIPQPNQSASHILSDEELAMLLDLDPPEKPRDL